MPQAAPSPRVERVRGPDAVARVVHTLTRFEPAVLLTADGRGVIHAPSGDGELRRMWLLADAGAAAGWEAALRRELTLTFLSRDERIYLRVSGAGRPVTEPGAAGALWRLSFERWFPGGPGDPRLLLVAFTTSSADYHEAESGRVSPPA